MARRLYWLSDAEWVRIEPHLPHGRRGARRVDDRRVISGIVHMLRSGARWRLCINIFQVHNLHLGDVHTQFDHSKTSIGCFSSRMHVEPSHHANAHQPSLAGCPEMVVAVMRVTPWKASSPSQQERQWRAEERDRKQQQRGWRGEGLNHGTLWSMATAWQPPFPNPLFLSGR